jgi:hypothetical protein
MVNMSSVWISMASGWLGRKHSDGRPVVGYDVIPNSLQQLQYVHIPAIQRK